MCAVPLSVAAACIRGANEWNGVEALALWTNSRCSCCFQRRGEGASEAARLLPVKADLQFGVTVGAGHFHQIEVPEQVTSMIERFIHVAVLEAPG